MHLKSLTLKGFKSFASSTTFEFEPGVTCVVGPNGSGKSNVVDAMSWVMGEQGARALRSGSMQDVIFSGSSTRPALGRAEVILTIDNSDGALPIEFTEVTIARTLFRNGTSEYAINGEQCRLLDVQELLSDSGVGRQMHVIVGQNQLGSILRSTAEERRGFVEEAAGVLKYRKRKEKALRKLQAMEGNLQRLSDLTGEIRRQLKPLGRQAEAARRASIIQADARDARLRLLADDLVQMREVMQREIADETALRERRDEVDAALSEARALEQGLEQAQTEHTPLAAAIDENWMALANLRERTAGLMALARERLRLLNDEDASDDTPFRNPAELDEQAHQHRSVEHELAGVLEGERLALTQATAVRVECEQTLAHFDQAIDQAQRANARRKEEIARLEQVLAAAMSRVDTREAELQRLIEQREHALGRAKEAQSAFIALEADSLGHDRSEMALDAEHSAAVDSRDAAQAVVDSLLNRQNETQRLLVGAQARVDALVDALADKDGAATLMAEQQLARLLGPLASQVRIERGYEDAIAAALGHVADAIAVADADAAAQAIGHLRSHESGRASMLITDVPPAPRQSAPAGSVAALDVIQSSAEVAAALSHLLARVAIVETIDEARRLIAVNSDWTAVTRQGDSLSRLIARGGSGSSSRVQLQGAHDEAVDTVATLSADAQRCAFELQSARDRVAAAQVEVDRTLSMLNDSDARIAALADQLGQHSSVMRSAQAEAERLAQTISDVTAARAVDQDAVGASRQRLDDALAQGEVHIPDDSDRQQLTGALAAAAAAEVDARLAVRTTEERVRAARTQAEAAERAAREARAAIERALRRQEQRERESRAAAAVLAGAQYLADTVAAVLASVEAKREQAAADAKERAEQMALVRSRVRELTSLHEQLADSAHKDDLARAEQRLRIEALEEKVLADFGVDAGSLIGEYGPDVLVSPSVVSPADDEETVDVPEPYPYVRAEQEKRLAEAERGLALLGRVNPLALEEYAAMEERHRFLTEQLEDLKKGRADLLTIVKEVDERIRDVFASAFADASGHFSDIFARLFPGGEARMFLTEPDDLLNTGIEIEARPPGKKARNLLALSGGESSLTAMAFLVALFKARPSPFYVLDEVESALDDTNLGRLIDVLADLRADSQMIIITHHKRTMEIADALYGVSMRGDGLSQVIGQRLADVVDELESASV